MANLSDKLGSLQFIPRPQSPYKAGAIVQVASNDVTAWEQAGWFKCDGSEYAEADYAQLFAVLGSKYNTGGETASHFRVPNGPRRTVEVDLSFSSTPAGWSLTKGKGFVYQTVLGEYRLAFNIVASVTDATGNAQVTVDGVDFFDFQTVNYLPDDNTGTGRAYVNNSNIVVGRGTSSAGFTVSGDVLLNSKPTDAFVGADSRFSTFDEALESIPMIKVYDDASNIAISLADATASLTGAVRLSSDFAATSSQYGLVLADKSQEKTLGGSVAGTSTDIITFNNLVIGKRYLLKGVLSVLTGSNQNANFDVCDGTNARLKGFTTFVSNESITASVTVEYEFIASNTVIKARTAPSFGAGSSVNPTTAGTNSSWLRITEQRNTVETTDFT